MSGDKTVAQNFKENQIRIRLARISDEASKKKPLQFKTPPRLYSLEDPIMVQDRIERKQIQANAIVSMVANRDPSFNIKKLPLVAQEKVEDYRQKMKEFVEIGGIKYRYSPADTITLDEHVPVPTFSQYELGVIQRQRTALADEISEYNQDLVSLQKRIKMLKRSLDSGNYADRDKLIDTIDEAEARGLEYERLIQINVSENLRLNALIATDNQNKKNNPRDEAMIKTANDMRVKNYQAQLNILNKNKFLTLQQQPFETTEDYLQRLEDEASQLYDDTIDNQKADEFNITVLKDNLKTITRDVGIIDLVLNSLKSDEIYFINKHWAYIKNLFNKSYGSFNKVLTGDDIVVFLLEQVYGDSKLASIPESSDEAADESFKTPPSSLQKKRVKVVDELKDFIERGNRRVEDEGTEDLTADLTADPTTQSSSIEKSDVQVGKFFVNVYEDDRVLYVQNRDTNKYFFLRLGNKNVNNILVSITNMGEDAYVVAGKSGGQTFPNGRLLQWLGRYSEAFEYPDDDIIKIFKNQTTKKNIYNVLATYIKKSEERTVLDNDGKIVKGYGIDLVIPRGLVNFGKIKINLYKLYYDNVLNVRRPGSSTNYNGLVNMRVSDAFVDCIMQVMKNTPVTTGSLKSMSIAEKETYDMLMTMSGINKQLPSHDGNDADHIKKLKERLVLIESEIMAGNNNINTLAELKKVLTRLHHFKVITGSQVTRHVAEIKKNYF
jgi:hypothetical protein